MVEMDIKTKELLDELLEKAFYLEIATIDENGFPQIRAVFNLRCKEHFPHPSKIIGEYDSEPYNVYISTNTSSTKVKHILENNKVALYFNISKPGYIKGVMLQGDAEILEDMEFKRKIWVEDWKIYYPKGYDDPDFTILKIKPNLLRGWYKGHYLYEFQK